MRLPPFLLPALSLACSAAPVFAAGEFRLPHQAGLFSGPGYRLGSTRLEAFTQTGWLAGYSYIGPLRAAWITDTSTGVTRRVGFFTGEEFQNDYGTTIGGLTEGGWVWGYSAGASQVLWVADGASGVTTRVTGLTGPEFTPPEGRQSRALREVTADGFAWGVSQRYRDSVALDETPWVMDCRTGAVAPAGLYDDPAHTWKDGTRASYGIQFTEGGWLYGSSARFGPSGKNGADLWVADAAAGVTRQVGLFTGSEYTRSTGERESLFVKAVGGLVAGEARRFSGLNYNGRAAWVADAAAGVTRRIGFFGPAHTEPPIGNQFSLVKFLTASGWVAGTSDGYGSGESAGTNAWVADARTGVTTRVGLFRGERGAVRGTDEVSFLTESGWVAGSASRQGGGADRALWVADARAGAVRGVGPTGGGYTHSGGGEYHVLLGVTESGWVTGRSSVFQRETGPAGEYGTGPEALWVADARTGAPRRMGLAGGEFVSSGGVSGGTLETATEAGKVYGYSWTYRGAAFSGVAAWAGDAATGSVTRIGLSGGEFLGGGDITQSVSLGARTRSGFISGTSFSYAVEYAYGNIPWVADAGVGRTWRCGIPGGTESRNRILTEGGLQAGATRMPGSLEETAWVMDAKTGVQTVFDLDRNPENGRGGSSITGITSGGVVYGSYRSFKNFPVGENRAFLWAGGLGTLLSEEPGPEGETAAGYRRLSHIQATGSGVIFSQAVTGSSTGVDGIGSGVFFGKAADLAAPGGGVGVTDLTRLPDGKYRLSFHTDAAVRITLQHSADLTTWTDGQTIDAPSGASRMDIEPAPAAAPNHYWRLKTAPASP